MIIKHRVNSIDELKKTSCKYGIELDIRSIEGKVSVTHDITLTAPTFKNWLDNYNHGLLALNVKEDGLEEQILKLLADYGISNYFFLDQPFPTLRKCLEKGISSAIRISEHENFPESINLEMDWVWVDSFYGNWDRVFEKIVEIENDKLRYCLVSPELQKRAPDYEIEQICKKIESYGIKVEAVCTKFPELWSQLE